MENATWKKKDAIRVHKIGVAARKTINQTKK